MNISIMPQSEPPIPIPTEIDVAKDVETVQNILTSKSDSEHDICHGAWEYFNSNFEYQTIHKQRDISFVFIIKNTLNKPNHPIEYIWRNNHLFEPFDLKEKIINACIFSFLNVESQELPTTTININDFALEPLTKFLLQSIRISTKTPTSISNDDATTYEDRLTALRKKKCINDPSWKDLAHDLAWPGRCDELAKLVILNPHELDYVDAPPEIHTILMFINDIKMAVQELGIWTAVVASADGGVVAAWLKQNWRFELERCNDRTYGYTLRKIGNPAQDSVRDLLEGDEIDWSQIRSDFGKAEIVFGTSAPVP